MDEFVLEGVKSCHVRSPMRLFVNFSGYRATSDVTVRVRFESHFNVLGTSVFVGDALISSGRGLFFIGNVQRAIRSHRFHFATNGPSYNPICEFLRVVPIDRATKAFVGYRNGNKNGVKLSLRALFQSRGSLVSIGVQVGVSSLFFSLSRFYGKGCLRST